MKPNLVREFISLNESASEKDIKRIKDLFVRSKGDDTKLLQLAQNMAASIDGVEKAQSRAEAAWQLLGANNNPIADIFLDRVKELGGGAALKNPGVSNSIQARTTIASAPQLSATNPRVSQSEHKNGVIFLPTYSAIALWDWELTGQFSDGAWENASPSDHWEFWCNLDVELGQPEVVAPGYPRKTGYGFGILIEYGIGDRMVKFGRYAKAVGPKVLKSIGSEVRSIIEEFPENGPFNLAEWKAKMIKGSSWRDKDYYWKGLDQEGVNAYYATVYTEKDMKRDLSIIKQAMKNISRRFNNF